MDDDTLLKTDVLPPKKRFHVGIPMINFMRGIHARVGAMFVLEWINVNPGSISNRW